MGNYNLNLDDDIHNALRENDEPIVDALNEAARQYLDLASMDNEAGLRRRLDDLDQRIDDWEAREARAAEKKEELKRQRETVVEKLEELQESKNSLTEDLDTLLDEMQETGKNVFPRHPDVDEIARTHDKTPDAVIDSLQDRSEERGLGLSKSRFTEKKASTVIAEGGDIR